MFTIISKHEKHVSKPKNNNKQAKKARSEPITEEKFLDILSKAKPSDTIKKLFLSQFDHGPALLEHFLQTHQLFGATKMKDLTLSHTDLVAILVQVIIIFDKVL